MLEIPDIKSCCPVFVFFGPLVVVVGFFFNLLFVGQRFRNYIIPVAFWGIQHPQWGHKLSNLYHQIMVPSCLQLENQHILMTWYMRITIIIPRNILCLWEYLVMQVILFSDCEICLVYGVELFVIDLKINGRWRNGKSTLFALYF